MNGLYHLQAAAQLPADSSGMMNMSDSEFGSSDSSSLGMHSHHPDPITMNGGRDQLMMMRTKVQNQTYVTQHQGALSHPISGYSGYSGQGFMQPMRSPCGGKPAAMKQQTCMINEVQDANRNNTTDHFLSQFQAQMSQMKSAMDAVQNEIFYHSPPSVVVPMGGGKPRAAAVAAMSAASGMPLKRGPGRPRGPSAATTSQSGLVRYQSQISTLNGLKLKIKKSPRQLKRKGSKGKGKKKKKKDDDEDEDDDESEEEMDHRRTTQQKSTKQSQIGTDAGDYHESAECPSGWGDSLPENILEKILSYAVKSEEGCIPVLVR
jgi:hypothetical protein